MRLQYIRLDSVQSEMGSSRIVLDLKDSAEGQKNLPWVLKSSGLGLGFEVFYYDF